MPSKLQLLLELALQKKGAYGARRVQRAADEIKNLEKTYSQGALEDAFLGDNAKALMTMNPADFERFAKKLQLEDPISREVAQKNINKLSRIRQGFADVPFLEIDRQKSEYLPNISGHEGRHRMRALEKKGEQESLVRLLPRQSLREDFPRYTQEEYIEALRKELGEKGLVTPEGAFRATPENPYGAIELPEIYAKGGKVSQDAMHMAVMNQKVQRKAKGDLVEDLIKEAKSKQEAPVNPFRMPTQKQSQYEKDFRQYLANQQAAREQVATELPSRLVRGAIPGAAGAIAGYAAQIPGTAGDIANLYQELKPESWRDLPDVVQALPTTERIQQYFMPAETTSPELQAGITGGNIAALGQGIASLPAAAKGIAKGATAGSKALANEAAYRIHQAMTSGEGALAPMLAGVAPKKMIPAWHGSPHDIPMGRSMLMEKIGTGEGAQAYGHGLYAAENKGVAKSYITNGKTVAYLDGKPISEIPNKSGAIDWISSYGDIATTKLALKGRRPDVIKEIDDLVASGRLKEPGNLYKLELSHPDPAKEKATPLSPNDFLHWDKPLSQQPKVIKALKGTDYEVGLSQKEAEKIADARLREEAQEWADETGGDPIDYSNNVDWEKYVDNIRKESGNIDSNITGRELHNIIMRDEGYRPELFDPENYQIGTSELLRSYGIPGIRYLDAGSRGAGEGTYNYVLFDPKLANIVGKEKKGGVIHKAEGGITSDDLIIEENPL